MATAIVDFRDLFIFILLLLFSVLFLCIFVFNKPKRSPQNAYNLPPSPRALPLIGHLHLLLTVPWYKSLQNLSSKYGPILHLRVFNTSIVLVSSASMAYEVFKTEDSNFSSRDATAIEKSLLFGSYGIVVAPYGSYWRFMKKLMVSHLLGQHALEKSRSVRGEELERFRLNLTEKAMRNEAVDVGMEMMKLTNNSICRMLMGRRCSEGNSEAEQVRDLVTKSFALTKKLLVASVLRKPLKTLRVSLFEKEIMEVSDRYDELFEKIIKEHEENPEKELKDMMDIMLEASQDENAEYNITRTHIKAFFVELFLGGTETSAQTTQWIMAELINHPDVLEKLRNEIESIVGTTRPLRETDIPRLPYLRAVVKEGLRLHPHSPILSRKGREECNIGGFDVPRDTTVIVNAYAVMRDSGSWENPEEFRPERFVVSTAKEEEDEMKDGAMRFIPFGGGRRGCPGANLGFVFMGMAIGTMVHCFDWRINGEMVDMKETSDLNLTKAQPLVCFPTVRTVQAVEIEDVTMKREA